MSEWKASIAALDLAYEMGCFNAGQAVPQPACSSRPSTRTKAFCITFNEDVAVAIGEEDSLAYHEVVMKHEHLCGWSAKPWQLKESKNGKPCPLGEPLSTKAVSISRHGSRTSCSRRQYEAHLDEVSWVQTGKPTVLRNDVEAPGWAVSMAQYHHDPPPEDHQPESFEGGESGEGESPGTIQGSGSEHQNHIDESLQSVLLFHLDEPVVHGHVHWTHIEDVITEISSIMGVGRNRIFNVHELRWTPHDIPEHFAPLIVQFNDDIPPGQRGHLCLVDVEVHANIAEFNYATIPAIDRRVLTLPVQVHRKHILEVTLTAPYCRQVQHRCLVFHNNIIVKIQENGVLHTQHGDHIRVVVPPDLFCDDATSFRLNEALEQEEQAAQQQNDQLRTPEEGYSPSLVPSEEIREEFGEGGDSEGLSLLQVGQFSDEAIETPKQMVVPNIHAQESVLPGGYCDGPAPEKCSWTEEFLRAMGALSVAQDDMPEFPLPDPGIVQEHPQWVQDLLPIWHQNAQPGPAGVEMLARVETWFTDHLRMQDCFQSRIVILAADFTTWYQDITRAWSEVIIPQFEVEIHLVYPTTVDVAAGAVAQLILVQRPDQFQKSIVVTIADTALQRGMPRSRAVVATDRVSLHSMLLMTGLLYECPPEHIQHRCHLWFEGQEITGEQSHRARHGDAFLLHVLREEDLPAFEHLTYSDEQIQIGLNALLSSPRPSGVAYGPDWFHSLERAFEAGAAVEMLEEGQVAYVLTWFVDAARGNFCQHPRVVRLNGDRRLWRPEILGQWQFDLAPNCPAEIHFVDPEPPKTPWESHIAHVIIAQRTEPDHAAVIINAVSWDDYPNVHQSLYYIHNMVSMQEIIARHAQEMCRGRACRVRRGNLFFDFTERSRIGNGDSIEIDIMPPLRREEDHMNLLQTHAVRIGAKASPVQISLEASIPESGFEIGENHFFPEVLVAENADDKCFLRSEALHFLGLPPSVDLTAKSLHAMQEPFLYMEKELAGSVALYVDGAAKENKSAWSVVAVSYDQYGVPALMGVLASLVECDPQSPQWIGATHHDNIAAELTASVAAHLVALSIEGTANVIIRPDLKLSAMVSTASWTCSSHRSLTQLASCLGDVLHQQGGVVREVRGHSGHPWNDAADSMAKFALYTSQNVGSIDFGGCHEVVISGDLRWKWLWNYGDTLQQVFPHGTIPNSWVITPAHGRIQSSQPKISTESESWAGIDFKIATANVLALNERDDFQNTESVSARAERLDLQWHEEGWAVVGVQESRRPEGRYQTTHFTILASGAKIINGIPHFGCELWIHKHFQIGKDAGWKLAEAKATAAWADPRRLVVNLFLNQNALSFVVLHAPCRSAATSIEQVQAWWDETASILRKASVSDLAWMMVDANAPLASRVTENFGNWGAEVMNEQGYIFENFLEENNLFAPTTMEWCHRGNHHTWCHPRGAKLRRDYIVCTEKALECCWESGTCETQDFGFTHDDHLPVQLRICGWWPKVTAEKKWQWDRLAMLDPQKCRAFQQALTTLPMPSWSVHTDDHARYWQKSVMALARQHFTKVTKEKVRPKLTETTIALIQLKRSALDYGRYHGILKDDSYRSEIKSLESQVRKAVREDQKHFYDNLVDQLKNADELHDFRLVYRLLSRLGGRPMHKSGQRNPLPLLRKGEGDPIGSYREQQRMWLQQFAQVEGGIPMSRDSLEHMMPPSIGLPPDVVSLDAVPTVDQITLKVRAIKRGKAPGPDGIPPDVIKAGAGPMVAHIAALTTKVSLRGKEPNDWRGGRLVPLHKGKLPRSDPAGYRSIFINDVITKLYHSTLRDHLADAWNARIKHIQFGGRNGCGTDTPHLLVQEHFRHSASTRTPAAVLFIDFKSAFYTVIRQGLFQNPVDDTALRAALSRFGMDPDVIHGLLQQASDDYATGGISQHAEFLLSDLFKATFFQVDGIDEVALTTKGTRPGDPVGDILFNMLMTVMMEEVTNYITSRTPARWQGDAKPHDNFHLSHEVHDFAWCEVAFVDDLAVLMRAPSQKELEDIIQLAFQAVYVVAEKRGLQLNMEAGKTEVLRAFVGKGAKQAKQQLILSNFLMPITVGENLMHLRVVQSYKHLGGWVHADGKPKHALRERIRNAKQAWGPLIQPFFRRKQVSLQAKVRVFESLVMSRMLFNAHALSRITEREVAVWEAAMRTMVVPMVGSKLEGLPPFTFTTETLCGLVGLLPPSDLLHVARLRFLPRLIGNCPQALWDLIHEGDHGGDSWISSTRASFKWLCTFMGPRLALSWEADLKDWWTMISFDEKWNLKVKRAARACRECRRECAEALVWEKKVESELRCDEALVDLHRKVPVATPWTCETCHALFATKKALAVHAMKQHDYRGIAFHYTVDGTCPNCSKCFSHRTRLANHLKAVDECFSRVRACFPPLGRDTILEMAEEDKIHMREMKGQGWLSTKALIPVIRAHGPRLPPCDSADARVMLQRWTARRPPDNSPMFEALEGYCVETIEESTSKSTEDDGMIPFVVMSAGGDVEGVAGRFSMGGLAKLHAALHIKTLCFIHFFSGYRRQGDIQHQIEARWDCENVQIFCVSVDFCIQKNGGDLTLESSKQFWLERIYSGAVCGAGGGPPCETYTAARHMPDGPPPLRSHDWPQGLPHNSQKSWRQTRVGSILMRFMLTMICALARVGGMALLEHPAFPVWIASKRPSSIWSCKVVRWLKRLHCTQIATFDQCLYGCRARKPTTFLLIRMPSLWKEIVNLGHAGRCNHPHGTHRVLKGRDSEGVFNTAVAKIYPEKLNLAISKAVYKSVHEFAELRERVDPLPEELYRFLSFDFVADSIVQPDCYV